MTNALPKTIRYYRLTTFLSAEVDTDSQGLSVEHLAKVLDNWESERPGKTRPKLLYTIPTGSNPTGCSIGEARKIEV